MIRQRKRRVRLALEASAEEDRPVLRAVRRDALLHLWTEMPHEPLDGPRGCVAEGADRPAFDLFARGGEVRGG